MQAFAKLCVLFGIVMSVSGCPMPEVGSGAIGPGSGPEASDDSTYTCCG